MSIYGPSIHFTAPRVDAPALTTFAVAAGPAISTGHPVAVLPVHHQHSCFIHPRTRCQYAGVSAVQTWRQKKARSDFKAFGVERCDPHGFRNLSGQKKLIHAETDHSIPASALNPALNTPNLPLARGLAREKISCRTNLDETASLAHHQRMAKLSERLRKWRKGHTRQQSAERLGVSPRSLQQWEQGRRTPRGIALTALEEKILQKF